MAEHPDLPGWEIKATRFDCGTKWGVGAMAERGGKIRRFAVRAPDDLNEEDAIAQAIPLLKEWVAENEAHWLRYA